MTSDVYFIGRLYTSVYNSGSTPPLMSFGRAIRLSVALLSDQMSLFKYSQAVGQSVPGSDP